MKVWGMYSGSISPGAKKRQMTMYIMRAKGESKDQPGELVRSSNEAEKKSRGRTKAREEHGI